MRPLILCLERLERILSILDRRGGELPVREFERSFSVWRWEVEQAAQLGWIVIETRKPRTGRPAQIARRLSKSPAAKLPPLRNRLGKAISYRHWDFADATLLARRWGRTVCGFTFITRTDAYLECFPCARSRAAASVSASRLMRHWHVQSARAWLSAKSNGEIPLDAPNPQTPEEIHRQLAAIRAARKKFAC